MTRFQVGDMVTYNDAIAPGEVVGLRSGLVDVRVADITYYGMLATDLTLVSRPNYETAPWIPTPGTRVNTPMGTGVIIPNEEGGSNISVRLDSGAGMYVARYGSNAVTGAVWRNPGEPLTPVPDKRETGQGIVKMPIKPLGHQRLQTTLWDPMDDTFLEDA